MKTRFTTRLLAGAAFGALAFATSAAAHDGVHHGPAKPAAVAAAPAPDVPLFDTLGSHGYRVSTTNPLAQRYFDQGLRWTWAFNHSAALQSFRAGQAIDPTCAMCFWGEAFVLGPNINAPMEPEAVKPALAALRRAQALAARAAPRERGLIEALSARYSDAPGADQAALNEAYAAKMTALAERMPDDDEIATLAVDAVMNVTPWDYWLDGGITPKPVTERMIATLERVLARNPDHPGAIHLYIHVVEASTSPERAEPHADRLASLMPGAGHIVHMPAHIYQRVGRWRDSLETNRKAVAADEAFFRRVGQEPGKDGPALYSDGYYPHNLHFLMTSAQMAGDVAAIQEAAAKLDTLVSPRMAREVAWLQPIKAATYFAQAQFGAPEAVLALPDPGGELPYVRAAWHYARGVAHAARGEAASAGREAGSIDAIASGADFANEEAQGLPARKLLELASLVVRGRIAQQAGDLAEAARLLGKAAEIEDGIAYMEPAYWYYPVRQTLGAVHLAAGDLDAAEAAFAHALKQTPNNGWALWGLRETHLRAGDAAAAEEVGARLKAAWHGDPGILTLDRL